MLVPDIVDARNIVAHEVERDSRFGGHRAVGRAGGDNARQTETRLRFALQCDDARVNVIHGVRQFVLHGVEVFARRARRHHGGGVCAQCDGDVRHLARSLAFGEDDFAETGALGAKMIEFREIKVIVAHAALKIRRCFVNRNGAVAYRLEKARKRGTFIISHGDARFSGGAKRPPSCIL